MSRTYVDAASVLDAFLKKKGGIKSLAYASHVCNKKAVYALVTETLKCVFVCSLYLRCLRFLKHNVVTDKEFLEEIVSKTKLHNHKQVIFDSNFLVRAAVNNYLRNQQMILVSVFCCCAD